MDMSSGEVSYTKRYSIQFVPGNERTAPYWGLADEVGPKLASGSAKRLTLLLGFATPDGYGTPDIGNWDRRSQAYALEPKLRELATNMNLNTGSNSISEAQMREFLNRASTIPRFTEFYGEPAEFMRNISRRYEATSIKP